jgi:hypothetical protein
MSALEHLEARTLSPALATPQPASGRLRSGSAKGPESCPPFPPKSYGLRRYPRRGLRLRSPKLAGLEKGGEPVWTFGRRISSTLVTQASRPTPLFGGAAPMAVGPGSTARMGNRVFWNAPPVARDALCGMFRLTEPPYTCGGPRLAFLASPSLRRRMLS